MNLIEAKESFESRIPFVPKINPNLVSISSVFVMLLAAIALFADRLMASSLLVILSSFLDIFDGTIAKKHGMASKRGAGVDRVCDRMSDIIIIGSLGIKYSPILGLIAVTLTVMASYVSSVIEWVENSKAGEGLSSRWVRNLIIFIGIFLSVPIETLLIITAISVDSLVHRFPKLLKRPV